MGPTLALLAPSPPRAARSGPEFLLERGHHPPLAAGNGLRGAVGELDGALGRWLGAGNNGHSGV